MMPTPPDPKPYPGRIAKRPTPFTDQEYHTRLAAVKREMDTAGVDCLLVTEAGDICYLCGYSAESAYVSQGLAIFADEADPLLFVRRQDAPAGMYTSYMSNDRIVGYPERYIGAYNVDGFDFILGELIARGVKRLALQFGAVSGATLDKIRKNWPNLPLADMSETVIWKRLVKSVAEVQVQKEASLITDVALQKGVEAFATGPRECDVAAAIMAAEVTGTSTLAGDRPDWLQMPGGLQSGTSHICWTEGRIERGKHYNVELGACRYRYTVGLMRTVTIGPPSNKLATLYGHMIDGCNRALEAVKPGITCGQVAQTYVRHLDRAGYVKDSRCGYPIGINWLEASCSLRTDDPTIMAENMVFHLMLGTWITEDFGAVISETFVVTPGGCEVLSCFPRQLIVV